MLNIFRHQIFVFLWFITFSLLLSLPKHVGYKVSVCLSVCVCRLVKQTFDVMTSHQAHVLYYLPLFKGWLCGQLPMPSPLPPQPPDRKKQGRIHSYLIRLRVGRSSDMGSNRGTRAGAVMQKWPTYGQKNRRTVWQSGAKILDRVACTRLKKNP